MEPLLSSADLPEDDRKGREALGRYTLSLVRSADEPTFEAAYALLDAEFGARGELETKAALRGYLALATDVLGYRFIVARDEHGEIAAVRDCHVTADEKGRMLVVYLSHVLVLPPHRRSGVASLMRHVPAALGRRARAQLGGDFDILLAAEMEPYAPGEAETLVRLVVYGRSGFRVIDPNALPYLQPDYREHARIDADRLRPVPLMAVVRWVGHEKNTAIPRRLARAYVEHLYRIVTSHCRAKDLAPLAAHALEALDRAPPGDIPLLPLPRDAADTAALAPLSHDLVFSYHSPSLLGEAP